MVCSVKKKKGEKFEEPWRFSLALLWWCSTCFGIWDSHLQGVLALDQSQQLSQEPFEACPATGNEKRKEQPVLWQGWAWGAGFPPAILVLLLSMTTACLAYQGWSLAFSQAIPRGRIFSQPAPHCSRGHRGCVTSVKRSCDKSCHGSTSAVQIWLVSGWGSGWGWGVSIWSFI